MVADDSKMVVFEAAVAQINGTTSSIYLARLCWVGRGTPLNLQASIP